MKYLCQQCGEEIESSEPPFNHTRWEEDEKSFGPLPVECGPLEPIQLNKETP